VPKAVREKLFKRRATKDRLQVLFDTYAFCQRSDGYESGHSRFPTRGAGCLGADDRGEVEAVVQASELGATVIVDEPWGRELAARDDPDFHGTLWVLQRFYDRFLGITTTPWDPAAWAGPE
jgi:hypothetical protein